MNIFEEIFDSIKAHFTFDKTATFIMRALIPLVKILADGRIDTSDIPTIVETVYPLLPDNYAQEHTLDELRQSATVLVGAYKDIKGILKH